MTRSQRLAPVHDVIENVERRLAQSVASYERRLSEADAKQFELVRYRNEYEQQFSVRAAAGMGVAELRDYQAFLARLSEAIRQQQAIVNRIRADRDAERCRWQEAAKRTKAIEHVVTQWQRQEQRIADQCEQRDMDERAQRAARREL